MSAWLAAHWPVPALYLAAMNVLAFALMGMDKRRARRGAWRISERGLFLAALLGGALGAVLGKRAFRHMTRHWYFKFGMPAILAGQIALAVWLWLR